MTDKASTAVLELLSSRICHDIISPVGAINNGVEFMEEMGADAGEEAIELISYSATQAAAKLQAFRMAYGAGGNDPNIKPEDVQKAFSSLISGEGKISQSWDPFGPLGPKPLPDGFCKILLCGMMLAMEALPKGGMVSVKAGENKDTLITAEGEGAKFRESTKEALANDIPEEDIDPRLVHPYVVGLMATQYKSKLSISEESENKIVLTLAFPEHQ